MVLVAVITGSSASGVACMRALLEAPPGTGVTSVRGCFRSQARADDVDAQLRTAAAAGTGPLYGSVVGVDAADVESLRRALRGADRALLVTPLDYGAGLQDDAANSINMIRAAHDEGVKRVIHVGSWTVKAPDRLPILSSRFVPTEEYLKNEAGPAMGWTVLRGGYFVDNVAHVHGANIAERDELAAVPDCKIPLVNVQDIGEAAARLLEMDDKTYAGGGYDRSFVECCGPDNLSHSQIADRLSVGLGRTIRYAASYTAPSLQEWEAGNPIVDELYRYMADDTASGVPYDPEPFARILGRFPTSLEQWAASNKSLFEKK